MSHIYSLLFVLINVFTLVTCYTKCKEFIIIMKETSCPTSASPIREPIQLEDIHWNHDDCSDDSLRILSYDKEHSNTSYLIKFDYVGFETLCIPIFKSRKIFDHITIDPENITTDEEEKLEKDTKTSSLLECLINNYEQTCDRKEAKETFEEKINKTVDIDLIYVKQPTENDTDITFNKTETSLIFEQCVLTEYLCKNSNTIEHSISDITFSLIGNEDMSASPAIDNFKYTDSFNCENIINNHKSLNITHVKALITLIITKQACQNESIDSPNPTKNRPVYNVRVYTPNDLTVLNAKHINCSNNLKFDNSTALKIKCDIYETVETHEKKNKYNTGSGNSSTDTYSVEEDFLYSLMYRCQLEENTIIKENYTETEEIFKPYKVYNFGNCTKDYKSNYKHDLLPTSKELINSSEISKDNLANKSNKEDFAPSTDSVIIKLQVIPNNVSDCTETIPINIFKGRIISLWSNDEEELHNKLNFTIFQLTMTKCYNYNKTNLQSDGSLELDIIFVNGKYSTLNESYAYNFQNTLFSSPNRFLLNCIYSNQSTDPSVLDNNINSVMKCKYTELDINSTVENSTVKVDLRNSKIVLKENATTESNTAGKREMMQTNATEVDATQEEMYYVSPRVYVVAVISILAVITSVAIYAFCLFKTKEHEYEVTPTRDWTKMDESEF